MDFIKIKMKVKDIVRLGYACDFGLNQYCILDGADGEEYVECELYNSNEDYVDIRPVGSKGRDAPFPF
jgi:hypothetical protein